MNIVNKLKGHPQVGEGTAYAILFAIATCHLLNDMIQSVIPAMYPLLKDNFGFTYETLDKYIRTNECLDINIKNKIDNMHEKNLFKLQLMDSFKYTISGIINRNINTFIFIHILFLFN